MNLDLFLPDKSWTSDGKKLIKEPKVIASLVAIGIITGPFSLLVLPGILFSPTILWGYLAFYIIKKQKEKKIKAILSAFGNQYSEEQLNNLYSENYNEFKRLYLLASNESFRKYIKEQSEHKKAQEIIIRLQNQINEMREKLNLLLAKEKKNQKAIAELQKEIELYDEMLKQWEK